MNKVNIINQKNKELKYKPGDFFIYKEGGETYILVNSRSYGYACIRLEDGVLWTDFEKNTEIATSGLKFLGRNAKIDIDLSGEKD